MTDPCPYTAGPHPWGQRAAELWDEYSAYADFEAWLEWMREGEAKECFALLESAGTAVSLASLYSVMFDLCQPKEPEL